MRFIYNLRQLEQLKKKSYYVKKNGLLDILSKEKI